MKIIKRLFGFGSDSRFCYAFRKVRMQNLTEKIKQKAIGIGFQKIGIVRAEKLENEGEHLKQWLEKDFHGEMKWLEREPEKRADPELLFPGAKSVIVVALNYFTPHEHEENAEKGKISRYAWGDDYHDVVKEKLRELFDFYKNGKAGRGREIMR